ncbi:MAG: hypothetical protein D6723_09720 [Acidobacteria bacterium]|nr:MAG: hypothetical protein D6723_09720 [Acidobacteriota bacterium]
MNDEASANESAGERARRSKENGENMLQCCTICGRTISDRELHEALENHIIDAIGQEHPEWIESDGACSRCVEHYRSILAHRHQPPTRRSVPWWRRLFPWL